MKIVSFYISSFIRVHIFVFRYDELQMALRARKVSGAFENQAQVSEGNLNFLRNAQGPGKPSHEYLRKVYQNNNKNVLPVLRYSTIPDLSFESFNF